MQYHYHGELPVNNPLSGPEFSTWSRSSQTGPNTDMFQEETDAGFATTYGESAETSSTSTSKARSTSKLSSLDNQYAPVVFHGLSSEDAAEFLDYVERFTTYNQMSVDEKVQFVDIPLRSTASDFYDSLSSNTDPDSSLSWETFKNAFLVCFGQLQATSWRDVQEMFATPQRLDETASDFIARVTCIAKRVPDVDQSLLQHAILGNLRPELRTHVLQAQSTSLDDLTQAARIADAAVATSNPVLSQVLNKIKTSNAQHACHNAAFQQLSTRLDELQVTRVSLNSNSGPKHQVRFNTASPRPQSPSPRRFQPQNQPTNITWMLSESNQWQQLFPLRYDTAFC